MVDRDLLLNGMNKLTTNLKKLRGIAPDQEYSEQSLRVILASKIRTEDPGYSWSPLMFLRLGAVIAVLAIIVVTGLRFNNTSKLSSLDISGLKAEAQELDVQLKLAQATSSLESGGIVSTALKETAQNGPGQLNTTVLQKESGNFSIPDYDSMVNTDRALKELTK